MRVTAAASQRLPASSVRVEVGGSARWLVALVALGLLACVDRGVVGTTDGGAAASGAPPAAPTDRDGDTDEDDDDDSDDEHDEGGDDDDDDLEIEEGAGSEAEPAEGDLGEDGSRSGAVPAAGADGAVGGCGGADACPAPRPFCVDARCVECREDQDCASDDCDDGRCRPDDDGEREDDDDEHDEDDGGLGDDA